MICNNCGREVGEEDHFCSSCGVSLVPEEPSEQGPPPSEGEASGPPGATDTPDVATQLQALQSTVDAMRADVARNSERLLLVERVLSVDLRENVAASGLDAIATTSHPAASPASLRPLEASGQPAFQAVPPAPPPPAVPPGGGAPLFGTWDLRRPDWDWEWLLGGNWLARIGVVALVIGIGFFLKLAFDNVWIGETGRVVLGLVGGLALIGAGEFWRGKYPIWALPLTGGGLAILYLSIFAAFSLYGLIPALLALGFFFLVTLTAAGLALRYESLSIAVLGILGGFITPILLGDQLPDQRVLLAYVLVLDLGVLALATFRNWRWFTLLGLVGSLVLYQFWRMELDPGLLLASVGITVIFLIFVGATTLFHLLWRREPRSFDHALVLLNAAAYFGFSYDLLFDEFRPWMGGFTLLLGLFYILLAYGIFTRHREQVHHSLFAIGIAAVFVTIAVPVQLDGPWISVAWAVEGVVLVWLSFQFGMPQLRWFGLGAFAIFTFWLLLIDTPDALSGSVTPFLNIYTFAYAAAIVASFLAAYFIYRERDGLLQWERVLFPGFLVAGNVFLTVSVPVHADGAWVPIVWAVEGLVIMAASFRLGLVELRLISLGVYAITLVRLLTFETFGLSGGCDFFCIDLAADRPVLSLRFLAFAVGVASLYLGALALWHWRDDYYDEREQYFLPLLLVAANLLTLWALSVEIIIATESDYFSVPPEIAGDVASVSLSILWAVYAAALIVVGIVWRSRWIRIGGLALLAVPVLKLFLVDSFALDQEYRVVAYLALGLVLVIGGFLYQRFSRTIREFLLE